MGGLILVIVVLISGIFIFLMLNDVYFYGVLLILLEMVVVYGVDKVEIVRVFIIG